MKRIHPTRLAFAVLFLSVVASIVAWQYNVEILKTRAETTFVVLVDDAFRSFQGKAAQITDPKQFELGAFLSASIPDGTGYQAIGFRVYSKENGTEHLLYDTKPNMALFPAGTVLFKKQALVTVLGTPWTIEAVARPDDVISTLEKRFSQYILLAGLAGSISLFGIILSLSSARRRAVDLAEIMTTSLKQRTDELEISKDHVEHERRKLTAILSSMGEGLIAVSNEGKIMLINQSAQATLGVPHEESFGRNIEDVLLLLRDKKEVLPKAEYPVYKVLDAGGIDRIYLHDNVYFKDNYGQIFPVVLSAISLAGEARAAEGIAAIVVFRDVTLEKAVDEAKTEFVSLAAHQLRMPLTTIRWYAEMLMSGDAGALTDTQRAYLIEISESNRRMVTLVNQLLTVSRIRLGTFKIEPVPSDLGLIVDSVLSELQPQIDKKKMIIKKQYVSGSEKFTVDPDLTRVIFQNLISNAVKYTPDGGSITITIEAGDRLILRVADTGYGIPKLDHQKIFTQLYRAENIKDKDVEGTGLGLYMVKTVVDQSGGSISFDSTENVGSTFSVVFPLSGMKPKEGNKSLS